MPLDTAKRFRISGQRGLIHVSGEVERTLLFRADGFFQDLLALPSTREFDLLHIAAGAYAVDRIVRRERRAGNDSGIRTLSLTLVVGDIAFWRCREISDRVVELLGFLTDENWSVDFESSDGVASGHQNPLALPWHYSPKRIALYSGGLDSAAGLASQMIRGQREYLLLTVSHQSGLRRRTRDQLQHLAKALGIEERIHSTLVTALRRTPIKQQEKTQRTRALLFCSAAVLAAKAFRIGDIEVFENGPGTINFPLMTGMLFGGLATRGSHPTFLAKMSELASAVAEERIHFTLPFAASTKGEMLSIVRDGALGEWVQQSRSCVHTSWRDVGKSHCGTCPACLERRQAFAVAGISEANVYSHDIFAAPPKPGNDADYFRLLRDEARAWLAGDPRVRRRMDSHLSRTGVPTADHARILGLQTRHTREVLSVFDSASDAARPRRHSRSAAGARS